MSKNKTIWLINQYASTPETGIGGRHYYLGRELVKQGYKVYVVAASFHHLLRQPKVLKDDYQVDEHEGLRIVWLKQAPYKQAHSKRRVFNWLSFMMQLRRLEDIIAERPDYILYSSPSLFGFLGAKRLAKRYAAKLIFEVRDIWPLTLIKLGGLSPKNPLILLMQAIEKYAYRQCDVAVSNLQNAHLHMTEHGLNRDKFYWIPNGLCLEEVEQSEPLEASVIRQLPKDRFIVGYTGTLGLANDMETFILAAEKLKNEPEISFVLVGSGREKGRLKALVDTKNLKNVIFIDAIPKKQVQSILKRFDVCYIGWKDESIYQFGIAANKLFDYLYANKPVIHAYSGGGDLISDYGVGITVPAEQPAAVAEAVKRLFKMKSGEREVMGSRGRLAVLAKHEYGTISKSLANVIFDETDRC